MNINTIFDSSLGTNWLNKSFINKQQISVFQKLISPLAAAIWYYLGMFTFAQGLSALINLSPSKYKSL